MRKALLLAVCIVVSAGMSLQGSPITVVNSSFEDDVLAPGGFTVNTFLDGWTCGPNASASSICGAFRPQAAQYINPLPNGVNLAYSNGGNISQTLATNLAPNTTYTLTVSVGRRLDDPFPGYQVWLSSGIASNILAFDNNTLNPNAGDFLLSTVQYTSGASVTAAPLIITLVGQNGLQTNFDNVSLDATSNAVPEPGTAAFCLIGLALVCIPKKLRGVLARR